jgi:transposase InsO family protein
VLEQLIEMHGKPRALRMDNGAEFTAHAFTEWCEERKIDLYYIEPGKPDQYVAASFMCSQVPDRLDLQAALQFCST